MNKIINANTRPVKMDRRLTESQSAVFSAVILQTVRWRAMMRKSGESSGVGGEKREAILHHQA